MGRPAASLPISSPFPLDSAHSDGECGGMLLCEVWDESTWWISALFLIAFRSAQATDERLEFTSFHENMRLAGEKNVQFIGNLLV